MDLKWNNRKFKKYLLIIVAPGNYQKIDPQKEMRLDKMLLIMWVFAPVSLKTKMPEHFNENQ